MQIVLKQRNRGWVTTKCLQGAPFRTVFVSSSSFAKNSLLFAYPSHSVAYSPDDFDDITCTASPGHCLGVRQIQIHMVGFVFCAIKRLSLCLCLWPPFRCASSAAVGLCNASVGLWLPGRFSIKYLQKWIVLNGPPHTNTVSEFRSALGRSLPRLPLDSHPPTNQQQ